MATIPVILVKDPSEKTTALPLRIIPAAPVEETAAPVERKKKKISIAVERQFDNLALPIEDIESNLPPSTPVEKDDSPQSYTTEIQPISPSDYIKTVPVSRTAINPTSPTAQNLNDSSRSWGEEEDDGLPANFKLKKLGNAAAKTSDDSIQIFVPSTSGPFSTYFKTMARY